MSSARFRHLRRAAARYFGTSLAGFAGRGGIDRIRRVGRLVGTIHHALTGPFQGRLRRDIGRALGCSRSEARRILAGGYRVNDRAVFEVLALSVPDCDPEALVDAVVIEQIERLPPPGQGAVLLGMHMGNGILMASKLARAGWPVHVVAREPRRLAEGTLARAIERAGATPLALDRSNPTRSFRQMLKVLRDGGLLYVLMDQANKGEGVPQRFLGKPMNMPGGVPGLALRCGVPVIPVHLEAAEPDWVFRVGAALAGDDEDSLLDAICASMEQQVRRLPGLWSWHQRRWKRYDFGSSPNSLERS
jgi:lauroyl/myristoyl acyltransferase